MIRWLCTCLLTAGLMAAAAAEDPKPLDAKAFDKAVVDTLREVHNKGADLYNTARDFPGAYRLYQGALITVRPFLAHRAESQKLIDAGLTTAEQETDPARRAFVLHETIEKVRANLKSTLPKADAPKTDAPKSDKPKTDTPKTDKPKTDTPKSDLPKTDKPKSDTPKTDPPKGDTVALTTKPKEVANPDPAKAKSDGLTGRVTLAGQPISDVDVTFVSVSLPLPRIFTTSTWRSGGYAFPGPLPPAQYVVLIGGKGVPEKYLTVTTSSPRVTVTAKAEPVNIELK
jgi:hypothetical protein